MKNRQIYDATGVLLVDLRTLISELDDFLEESESTAGAMVALRLNTWFLEFRFCAGDAYINHSPAIPSEVANFLLAFGADHLSDDPWSYPVRARTNDGEICDVQLQDVQIRLPDLVTLIPEMADRPVSEWTRCLSNRKPNRVGSNGSSRRRQYSPRTELNVLLRRVLQDEYRNNGQFPDLEELLEIAESTGDGVITRITKDSVHWLDRAESKMTTTKKAIQNNVSKMRASIAEKEQ